MELRINLLVIINKKGTRMFKFLASELGLSLAEYIESNYMNFKFNQCYFKDENHSFFIGKDIHNLEVDRNESLLTIFDKIYLWGVISKCISKKIRLETKLNVMGVVKNDKV